MKKNKNSENRGAAGFDAYYTEVYGPRWNTLKNALSAESLHAGICYPSKKEYFLDPASLCAALCLPCSSSSRNFDMCAAPGGKSLVLAGCMNEEASLFSNERSAPRKKRLDSVLAESLEDSVLQRVRTFCGDAAVRCRRETECYDSILLDAPCSSERHVLADPRYLCEWSPARIKTLSMEQWALLSSAWKMLAPGGFILYATCALAPKENDGTIQRLLKKNPEARICTRETIRSIMTENLSHAKFSIKLPASCSVESVFDSAESTENGLHVLPDTSGGYGPLYFSLIHKPFAQTENGGQC